MAFYVDSCIYLNLWKREECNDKLFWKIATNFFERVQKTGEIIYISPFVMKELSFRLNTSTLQCRLGEIRSSSMFENIEANRDDYKEARRLESASEFEISFFDCMHVVLARRMGAVLVTRDNKLLDFAYIFCSVGRPEDFCE